MLKDEDVATPEYSKYIAAISKDEAKFIVIVAPGDVVFSAYQMSAEIAPPKLLFFCIARTQVALV